MQIIGVKGETAETINFELSRGAKFVAYQYCISLLVVTFKRSSNIYFVKANESRVTKGLGFTLLTLLLGWWGIPWGPIYTVSALATNLTGGQDVTANVVASFNKVAEETAAAKKK